jgi:hypothetical protein
MTKQELAGYMASLLTLLEHQDKSGVHIRSVQLGREFDRCWEELKDIITKEEKENARTSTNDASGTQAGAENERGESRRGGSNRRGFDEAERGSTTERAGAERASDDFDHSSRR